MLNQICVITVKVDDMDKGVEFYTNILDFNISKKYGENIISLEHNGLPFILEKSDETNSSSSNGVLFAIQSNDIHEDFQKLREKGVTILFDEPKPCPPGYYFVIEDYSGNHIEIIEFTR